MPAWPETRHTLLARLRDPADMQAWSEFTALYEPVLHRFALGRGLQEADALDITQQVLWAVARAADNWPGNAEPGRFRRWLATVTRNTTLNVVQRELKHRGSGRSSVWNFIQAQPAPDEDLARAWEMERLDEIFRAAARIVEKQFTPEVWQLFIRTTVEGEPIEAVARELQKSLGAAYTARSRVMTALRETAQALEQQDTLLEEPPEAISQEHQTGEKSA